MVDSGYPCRVDAVRKTMTVSGPPAGIVDVGGYRFPLCGLLETIGRIDADATLAAVPDPLLGQRLVGTAPIARPCRCALDGIGLNPLVARPSPARRALAPMAVAAG